MSMAKEVGMDTAEFELIEESGQHHLVVERFDRDPNDEKIHMCSAFGLMHIDISVAQVTSYENLFGLTRIVTKSQADVEELYKRMVFNILAYNFDDHTKNFSYLMDREGRWRLSPAYDISYSKEMAKALSIISKTIEVMRSFEERAENIGLDHQMVLECKEDIEDQISVVL